MAFVRKGRRKFAISKKEHEYMNILVIDGQGGGIGRQLVENIKKAFPEHTVTAIGTNALATQTMLKAGADKCSTNTAAIHNPQLLTDASKVVGSQAVVIGIDAKRRYVEEDKEAAKGKTIVDTDQGEVWFDCSIYGGREFTGMDAIAWAQECQDRGAGEVLLTSMDGDGTKDGYDLVLTKAINDNVDIPVIASGGVGNPHHILEAFEIADASAALAASIFHFDEYPVPVVKKYLKEKGVPIRETI